MATPPWPQVHADVYNALGTPTRLHITGRLVQEQGPVDLTRSRPLTQLMEREVKRCPIAIHIQGQRIETQSDEEGRFEVDASQSLTLAPGQSILTITPIDDHATELGRASVKVLRPDAPWTVIVSDIDLTYLNTPFASTSDKVQLLRDDARSRVSLVGMPALYRTVRRADTALVFLSGSPRFFKRVIEGKLRMDEIEHDALMLKHFKDIAYRTLRSWRPHQIMRALKAQVSYKLRALLLHRLRLPPSAHEVLLGDDSEADFVCYHLYAHILQGAWRLPDLKAQLQRLGVQGSKLDDLLTLSQQASAHTDVIRPIRFIGIRRTGVANERFDPQQWQRQEMIFHNDTLQLAGAMHEHGLLGLDDVAKVRKAMTHQGITDDELLQSLQEAQDSGLFTKPELDRLIRRPLGRRTT